MPYALHEDAFGDPGNAATLAAACQIAYLPGEQGETAFRDELGMTARFFSVDNTQAYLATNDDHIVVAFRGSQGPTSLDGLKDWLLTNAANLLIVPEGPLSTEFVAAGVGARFHQGFVGAVSEIWPVLFPAIEAEMQAKDRPLWVTGHSLGGAIAVLAAWLLKRKFVNVHQVVTFGGPMVGNAEASAAMNREFTGKIFRYVNGPDPVPLLPMMSLMSNGYQHCDQQVLLGATGEAANLIAYLTTAAGGAVDAVLAGSIADELWDGVKSRVNAHLLNDYRSLLNPE